MTEDRVPNEVEISVYELIDNTITTMNLSTDTDLDFTNCAYTWWIARHGVPATANAAREMFEFAARLEQVFTSYLKRAGFDV